METVSQQPDDLNYLHLRQFWVVARKGHMTRAAESLRISQSTLSEHVSQLEEWLGQRLFERQGRSLRLTEAGRVALEHAETIFATGRELVGRFRIGGLADRSTLRVGALGPLSKNLQFDFIQPWIDRVGVRTVVATASLDELLPQLRDHELDVVLSNVPPRADREPEFVSHPLGNLPVYLAGAAPLPRLKGPIPRALAGARLFLPTRESHVRADFDRLLLQARVEADVAAEVDDMALLRLLALSGRGLALVSAIVVERDIPTLAHLHRVPGLEERFYAITLKRRFENPTAQQAIELFKARLELLARTTARRRLLPKPPAGAGSGQARQSTRTR